MNLSYYRSSEVEDAEYNEFYKSFSRDSEDPLAKIHFTAEGEVTFKSILFIPKTSPVDWNSQSKVRVRVQLYQSVLSEFPLLNHVVFLVIMSSFPFVGSY